MYRLMIAASDELIHMICQIPELTSGMKVLQTSSNHSLDGKIELFCQNEQLISVINKIQSINIDDQISLDIYNLKLMHD